MDSTIVQIVLQATIGGLIGYIFMVIKDLKAKLDSAVSIDQVKELLKTRLEIVEVRHDSVSDDVKSIEHTLTRLEEKLDRLILK